MSMIKRFTAVLLKLAMFDTVSIGFATAVTAEIYNSQYDRLFHNRCCFGQEHLQQRRAGLL